MKVNEVEAFLEIAGKKGFLTKSVSKQTQAAIDKLKVVIESDPDKPVVDLSDGSVVEDLFRRFMIIRPGELSPESANVYVNRIKKVVDNCVRYNADPLAYKSNFGAGTTGKVGSSSRGKDSKRTVGPKKKDQSSALDSQQHSSGEYFLASYPLRKDFMLNMHLPKDLNTSEVKRMAFYLLSLCGDFNPVKPNIFYQDSGPNYSAIESRTS